MTMGKDDEITDDAIETAEVAPQGEEDLEAEVAILQDRVLRLQAEIQNLRTRQARELGDARQYAGIDLVRDILPVVDNIDRAINAAGEGTDVSSLLEGFKLVRQQLVTALAQHGCKEIAADGQEFNPDLHQAILQQPSPEVPAGEVMMVTQAGYQLHDRVVRAAQVIVSAGPGDQDSSGGDQ
jgi:molecular chaperone GrpE